MSEIGLKQDFNVPRPESSVFGTPSGIAGRCLIVVVAVIKRRPYRIGWLLIKWDKYPLTLDPSGTSHCSVDLYSQQLDLNLTDLSDMMSN
jgi:hypothetical protein